MKKWDKPKLCSLGIENTFEDSTIAKPENLHYCHGEGEFHINENCTHSRDNGHKLDGQIGHDWNQDHRSKCCCGIPGTS